MAMAMGPIISSIDTRPYHSIPYQEALHYSTQLNYSACIILIYHHTIVYLGELHADAEPEGGQVPIIPALTVIYLP